MKYLKLVGIILIFTTQVLTAQVKLRQVDFDMIKKNINKDNYILLLERYKNNDKTLTDIDYYYLYYGFYFNRTESNDITKDSLDNLLSRSGLYNQDTIKMALNLANRILEKEPLNLKYVGILSAIYATMNDFELSMLYGQKCSKLFFTVLSSGDARKKNTPWIIIHESDRDELLNFMNLKPNGKTKQNGSIESIYLEKNKQNIEIIYIDKSRTKN